MRTSLGRLDPPEENRPYNTAVLKAAQKWERNSDKRIQSERRALEIKLYAGLFPWRAAEIQSAMQPPLREDWESEVERIDAVAADKWKKLSGLRPPTLWNSVEWRRAAQLAGYSGAQEETIIDGLIARYTPTNPMAPGFTKDSDLIILEVLADNQGKLLTQEKIAGAIDAKRIPGVSVGLRTIQRRLKILCDCGFVVQPAGKRSGYQITQAGLASIPPH